MTLLILLHFFKFFVITFLLFNFYFHFRLQTLQKIKVESSIKVKDNLFSVSLLSQYSIKSMTENYYFKTSSQSPPILMKNNFYTLQSYGQFFINSFRSFTLHETFSNRYNVFFSILKDIKYSIIHPKEVIRQKSSKTDWAKEK